MAKTTKKAKKAKNNPNHVVISKNKNDQARWYVVHTYSGQENQVAEHLKQRVESMGLSGKILDRGRIDTTTVITTPYGRDGVPGKPAAKDFDHNR